MDELGIWERALSSAEIIQLYNGGAGLTFINFNPNITLNHPDDANTTLISTINFNGTAFDRLNLTNVSLILDGVINETNSSGLNDSNYIFTKILAVGNHNWTMEACNNQSNCVRAANRSIEIVNLIIINETFNNETTEGNSEAFEIWIETNQQLSSASLVYDDVVGPGSFVLRGGFVYEIDGTKNIPAVTSDTNKSFYWSITLQDGSIVNTTTHNQTILNIGIDDCSVEPNILFNLTIVDEETQLLLVNSTENTTIEVAINIYPTVDYAGTPILTFNESFGINPATVCIANLSNSNYFLDTVIKYFADDYSVEYHNILKSPLNSSSLNRNITLFDLLFVTTTDFQLTFKDRNLILAPNILVFVNRQYVDENSFKTVEIPKTDSNGQTILHLVRKDVL